MLLYGLALLAVMLLRPRGLWPAPQHGATVTPARGVAK